MKFLLLQCNVKKNNNKKIVLYEQKSKLMCNWSIKYIVLPQTFFV